eukprot:TRINITY_DN2744_c0_g1_i2.p1 TRINITY_DN2744_c0_g1~~TRINITY_DN2744_c0_g1_i2.p1  ORF type:complete len:147 (-),score=38.75 TRINITY_DN2744_c0_g1_i2:64-504(-)
MSLKTLREKHGRFEQKRNLSKSYDMFLCDDSIQLVLPRLLGKAFTKSKKYPIPIKVNQENLTRNVIKARDSTYLYLSSGDCLNVKVALTSMDEEQICENIIEAVGAIAKFIPRKWKNIKSLSIKTDESIALPIYNRLEPIKKVETE